MHTIFFVLLLLGSSFGGCPFQSKTRTGYVKRDDASPITLANQFFLRQYPSVISKVQEDVAPRTIILRNCYQEQISLIRDNLTVETIDTQSDLYDQYKGISHIAFTTQLLLEPTIFGMDPNLSTEFSIPADDIRSIETFIPMIQDVINDLDTCCNFTETVIQMETTLLNISLQTLQNALSSGTVSPATVSQFGSQTVPIIQNNVQLAIVELVNLIHSIVMKWKSEMTLDEWDQLRVIVMGPHMPRNRALEMQYFSRLLNSPEDSGMRIIYAENVMDEKEALGLLAVHYLDFAAGQTFWKEPEHMHSDIQADAVEKYLPTILPNSTIFINEH